MKRNSPPVSAFEEAAVPRWALDAMCRKQLRGRCRLRHHMGAGPGIRPDLCSAHFSPGQAALRSPSPRDLVLPLSGVDPAECARRAGQSIEVLFRHYAKFLDGLREQANRLIEQSMNEWQRVSQGDVPQG
ncbi:hypothetical protein [Streptomyces griseoluteus]|uniref:hypothetical protein n=1 Tax=Streptomyces griseoluteus TaxID=29306 RepID=UPI00382F4A1B